MMARDGAAFSTDDRGVRNTRGGGGLSSARRALERAVAASLRAGYGDPSLPFVVRRYLRTCRESGFVLSATDVLLDVMSIVLNYEQTERAFRDPFSRGRGAEDPVVYIGEACLAALRGEAIEPSAPQPVL